MDWNGLLSLNWNRVLNYAGICRIEQNEFTIEDSLIFVFILSNQTEIVATYLRLCSDYRNYLSIYRQDEDGVYQYYGRPEYNFTGTTIINSISDGETVELGKIPWS